MPTVSSGSNPVESPDGEHDLIEIELDNARFDPAPAASPLEIQPADGPYWIKRGELVAIRWDTWELHWQRKERSCSFPDNSSNEDCHVCETCSVGDMAVADPPCFGAQPVLEFPDAIVAYDGFMTSATRRPVGSLSGFDYLRGCPASTNPVTFEPKTSGIYQLLLPLKLPLATVPREVVAEKKIHVIEQGKIDKSAYRLTRQTVDGTDYWTWAVPGDERWMENFSPNLQATIVRVFKGRCVTDPNSGVCVAPTESQQVKPSRLLFLPDFSNTVSGHQREGDLRCYAAPGANNDYYFDLANCRNTYSTGPLPTRAILVTPTYERDQPLTKLTWLVQFNTAEGGDQIGADEELFIEFTVRAS
ncbi:MAG TPA: hypothetical protein VKC34_18405 [Blastocatellia bacterium]|nr:hypothetical protein [Blastocatellia bacterium]